MENSLFSEGKSCDCLGMPGKHPLGRSCTLGPKPCFHAFYLLNKPMDRIADLRTGMTHSSCNGLLLCSVCAEPPDTTDTSR